jgi:hypothetical protein
VKFITKILASRLQHEIKSLVDQDQSGFVRKRCIADNFMYAADIIQCCKQRKRKAIILKLDFTKAFDTISWPCLFQLFRIRGFPGRWINWINLLTQTAKTAVLLNGVPGPWIQMKRGLRQGDPISPLIFIVVADILQQTIRSFGQQDFLQHPILQNQPCPVLQYADDTLIIVKGGESQAK